MNRREFTRVVAAATLSVALNRGRTTAATSEFPQISITMDDFTWQNDLRMTGAERNQSILGTLNANSVKTALFVIGRNVEADEGKQLLRAWDRAGHLIGNHSYSHINYNAATTSTEFYEQDILRSEALLKDFPHFQKFFRFPMLKEGDTAAKRDEIRRFLTEHGYRVGHVTIDSSDWIIDQRLRQRLEKDPAADLTRYRDYYLQHMWDRAQYYDGLARKVLGRSVRHAILTHFNLLNALFLGDLMDMFSRKGWKWIDAEEAFGDPVFAAKPKILPAGESIVWALAKEKGTISKSLRYPAEDGTYEAAKMARLKL